MPNPHRLIAFLAIAGIFFTLDAASLNAATCIFNKPDLKRSVEIDCSAFTKGLIGIKLGQIKAEGGYGKVYSGVLVYDEKSIPVAIKEIQLKSRAAEGYSDLEGAAPTPTFKETRQEFRTLVKLYRNASLKPYLVNPYAYFEYADHAYLVMEDGGNALSSSLSSFRTNPTLLTTLATNLFDALKALHSAGLVHLDLHPDNVLVDGNARVKIIDFGFAKPKGSPIKTAGHRMWRDPHVYVVKKAYPAYDYFSVAAILFEILVGHKIYDYIGSSEEIEKSPIKPGLPNYQTYVSIHRDFMARCETTPCSKIYLLALALLNPDITQRIPTRKQEDVVDK